MRTKIIVEHATADVRVVLDVENQALSVEGEDKVRATDMHRMIVRAHSMVPPSSLPPHRLTPYEEAVIALGLQEKSQ